MNPLEIYEQQVLNAAYKESRNLVGLYEKSCGYAYFLKGAKWANSNPAPHIQKLLEALKFYANGNWADGYPGGIRCENNILDFGDTAQTALQEYERAVKE